MSITQNFKVEEREAQTFDPIPENVYQCELLDVEMLEKPKYQKPDEKENVFTFQFVLLSGKDKTGESLRGRNIWLNFVPTYFYIGKNGKNKLYQVVEALLSRELTREELATFESAKLNKLIGKQCRIVTKNKMSKDGKSVFSNIDSLIIAESLLTALSSEEKEKAKVKNKESQETVNSENSFSEQSNFDNSIPDDEIRVENIPF